MECVQLDLSSHELQNIWAIKFAKNSSINKNSRYAYKLPEYCYLENCFTVGIWFGDPLWTMKLFEYRIRWFKFKEKTDTRPKFTIELVSQKFLIGLMMPGEDLPITQLQLFPLYDGDDIIGT